MDEVRLLRFVPIVERAIGAKHAQAKQSLLAASKPSPSLVSLALRIREIMVKLSSEHFRAQFNKLFDKCRSAMSLLAGCGLWNHPTLVRSMAENDVIKRRVLVEVIYHCDLHSQYMQHSDITVSYTHLTLRTILLV